MAKLKFKDENNNFIPVVQDVKVNDVSVFDGKSANIVTESAYDGTNNPLATKNDIPTDTQDLTNGAGFITGINSGDVTNALGYTPYDSTNPSGYQTASDVAAAISGKQDTLVSGENIKTINNQSILGEGDIVINSLPSQSGHNGEFLTTDGTDASWATATKVTIREWL